MASRWVLACTPEPKIASLQASCLASTRVATPLTAGAICAAPRAEFFRHMDAANVDLKAFSEDFYRHVCAGHLEPVLDTLRYLKHDTDVWFEITNLVIPAHNDSREELDAMTRWVVDELGPGHAVDDRHEVAGLIGIVVVPQIRAGAPLKVFNRDIQRYVRADCRVESPLNCSG